jgi:hypothetical protein
MGALRSLINDNKSEDIDVEFDNLLIELINDFDNFNFDNFDIYGSNRGYIRNFEIKCNNNLNAKYIIE